MEQEQTATERRPDPAVLDRARAGDRAALDELLSELAPRIRRFGRHLCGQTDLDDVTQETLLSIVRGLPGWEGRGSLSSWVFALARSACARRRRGKKNAPHLSEEALEGEIAPAPDPEQQAQQSELGRALDRALARLSDDHREVILLRDVEGFTAPEAAATLGVSIDALKSRLHRARGVLRAELEQELGPTARPPKPGCPDVASAWSRHLEGEASDAAWAAVEAHADGCPACGEARRSLQTALDACRASGTLSCSQADVKRCVRAALEALDRA